MVYEKYVFQWLFVFVGICASNLGSVNSHKPQLDTLNSWNQLEFDFPSSVERQNFIERGDFIPGVPTPIDVDVFYSPNGTKYNKIFVTMPRFQAGVPIALGTVTNKKTSNGSAIIAPYPDWSWYLNSTQCNHNRIVSVFRIFIDECNRLWVLDTGSLISTVVCPPQIMAFDLTTNILIKRYELPSDQYESTSTFVTPVVDVRNHCTETFVYAADCETYSIVVYDFQKNQSWRIRDKTMYPYPSFGTYRILGHHFDLMDGILGMALEPLNNKNDRRLFFHAMSSPTENWVLTSNLRNQTRFLSDPNSSPEIFHTYKGQRDTQSAAIAIDQNGVLYSGLMTEVELICWNVQSDEYGPKYWDVVANDKTTLQFASGVKVITNKQKGYQELWVLTSRFQRIADGTLDTSDTNFRILVGKVDNILIRSNCKKPIRKSGY